MPLATADDAGQIDAINTLLACLAGENIKLHQLKAGELQAFLTAIPDFCQLKADTGKASKQPFLWGDIYAHLSSCYGWTYDYIDNHMTLSRLAEYDGYFAKHPPTHQLVAAYMGYEYQDKQAGSSFLAAIAAQVKGAQSTKHGTDSTRQQH